MILNDEDLEKHTPLRVSFSHYNTKEDIDRLIDAIVEIQEQQ